MIVELARAQGLAEAIATNNMPEINVIGLKAVAAEIVTLIATHRDDLDAERARLDQVEGALELVAAGPRSDGTYNRSREACEELAKAALGELRKPSPDTTGSTVPADWRRLNG